MNEIAAAQLGSLFSPEADFSQDTGGVDDDAEFAGGSDDIEIQAKQRVGDLQHDLASIQAQIGSLRRELDACDQEDAKSAAGGSLGNNLRRRSIDQQITALSKLERQENLELGSVSKGLRAHVAQKVHDLHHAQKAHQDHARTLKNQHLSAVSAARVHPAGSPQEKANAQTTGDAILSAEAAEDQTIGRIQTLLSEA